MCCEFDMNLHQPDMSWFDLYCEKIKTLMERRHVVSNPNLILEC